MDFSKSHFTETHLSFKNRVIINRGFCLHNLKPCANCKGIDNRATKIFSD